MRLLLCLAEKPGEVCTRDELHEQVWNGAIVGSDSLSRAVLELRKAFGDDPSDPHFVTTIRSVGYSLDVRVTESVGSDGHVNSNDIPIPILSVPISALSQSKESAGLLRKRYGLIMGFLVIVAAAVSWFVADLERVPRSVPVPRALTTDLNIEFDGALSPNGERLAFVWSGPDGDNLDIYLKPVEGGSAVRLTDHPPPGFDGTPNWSADGARIAFMRSYRGDCNIIVRQIDRRDERILAPCREHTESSMSWSSDGSWIAYADRKFPNSPYSLFLLSTQDLQLSELTRTPVGLYGDFDPYFSPDGSKVAFIRGEIEGNLAHLVSAAIGDIHVVDIETLEVTRITNDHRQINGLTWSPDGSNILFSSDRDTGTFNLWKVSLDNGVIRPVLSSRGILKNPSYSANTNRFVFGEYTGDTDIRKISLANEERTLSEFSTVYSSTFDESLPRISPDGSRIVFVSNRSGYPEIWASDIEGISPIQLTTYEGNYVGSPDWSPDGEHISFVAFDGNSADVMVMHRSGKAVRRITTSEAYDLVPSWSSDGRWIYFGSNRFGTWNVWKKRSDGAGEGIKVTSHGGFSTRESTFDGEKVLFFTKVRDDGLFRQDLASGKVSLVDIPLYRKDWGNWDIATDGVYFIQRKWGIGWYLSFFEFDSGDLQEVTKVEGNWAWTLPGVHISPDQSMLLYTESDLTNGDLLLVDESSTP